MLQDWQISEQRPRKKKSTTERITESCLKVLMENKIDQLEEKNHNVFHHKSSMKLVMCPRRKGRFLAGSVSPWDPALPLSPLFSFDHILLPYSPSSTRPSTLAEVLHVLPGQRECDLLQGACHRHNEPALPLYLLHLSAHSALGTRWIQIVVDRPSFPICTLTFYTWTQTFTSQKSKSRQPLKEIHSNA